MIVGSLDEEVGEVSGAIKVYENGIVHPIENSIDQKAEQSSGLFGGYELEFLLILLFFILCGKALIFALHGCNKNVIVTLWKNIL
ncbi:hypothetical protein ACIQD3_14785 [Peribacillus loiseleuriae]|uniref:hypothetical protein n=1 Tax=Peribacillus loiseleuriae TaxID=1679170 RepID=UPI003820236B